MNQKFSTIWYYVGWVVASALYVGLTLLAPLPAGTNTYNLSSSQIHLLQLSIVLPVAGIWLAAVYGASSFSRYSTGIESSHDGNALQTVSKGVTLLVVRIIASSIFDSLRPFVVKSGWLPTWTIITHYIVILLTLVSFYMIFMGAKRLFETLEKPPSMNLAKLVVMTTVGASTIAYGWALIQNPYRNSSVSALNQSFYLPDWALLITVVLVFAISWYLGFMAVAYLQKYGKYTKGILYKQALKPTAHGIGTIVVFSVVIQLLGALAPALHSFRLNGMLLLLYVLIILYGIGYALIAYGARKLHLIEEVKA
jgi:hypothetical protein